MKILLAIALLLPLAAAAQAPRYADADTPSEAVGMMKTTAAVAEKLREACGKRYPEIAAAVGSDLRKWQAADRAVIDRADFFWSSMTRRDPKVGDMLAVAVSASVANFQDLPAASGSQYCKQHFADLASGAWRTRTPKVYSYLEKISPGDQGVPEKKPSK